MHSKMSSTKLAAIFSRGGGGDEIRAHFTVVSENHISASANNFLSDLQIKNINVTVESDHQKRLISMTFATDIQRPKVDNSLDE